MGKTVIAVNAGPRKGRNTDTLITDASSGVEAAGVVVKRFDLYQLERYTGCVSCFGCKQERNKGHCVCRDGLTPVLDTIREADGLIIGSPNYLGELTASFRAFYERLVFQNLTYNRQTLSRFVGPTEAFVSGDTLQLYDYGKTDWEWSMFDPEAKRFRHETVFPQERQRTFDMGVALFKSVES